MGNKHHPGAISSRFHLSTDGSRIFNYSEWTTPDAHAEMLQTNLADGSPLFRFIKGLPGLRPLGFERYLLQRSIARLAPNHAAVRDVLDAARGGLDR